MNQEYIDEECEEVKEGDCTFTKDKMYGIHRCQEMIDHEECRNKNKTNYMLFRKFSIQHNGSGWYLYDRKTKGMEIIQCPFCSKKMFTGNQVVIE